MKIGAAVLAAGSSSRLGQPKQLLEFDGRSLVRRSAEAALRAQCFPVVVVVGQDRKRIAAILHDLPVRLVPNDDWQKGIGSSIRVGVEALKDGDALVILACDQPYVDANLINRLITAHRETGKLIVASAYAKTLGVPALFARACFDKLRSLPDAQGAKAIIAAHFGEVVAIDFPEGSVDIDTSADFRAFFS